MREFTVHIPRATGGCQKWNYSYNGYPIGQVYKYTDPGCGHDYICKPLCGDQKVFRFATFKKADRFMKESV